MNTQWYTDTETPYQFGGYPFWCQDIICNGACVAQARANTEEDVEKLAVKMVKKHNAHDELVAEMRVISEGINTYFDNRKHWTRDVLDSHLVGLQAVAKTALAKAEAK